MSQNFKCKESNCTKSVNYVPDDIVAFRKRTIFKEPKNRRSKTKTVYLTCSEGHTHPYIVKSQT